MCSPAAGKALQQCWYGHVPLLPSPAHLITPMYKLRVVLADDPFPEISSMGNKHNAYEVVLLGGPLLAAYQQSTSAKVVLPRGGGKSALVQVESIPDEPMATGK